MFFRFFRRQKPAQEAQELQLVEPTRLDRELLAKNRRSLEEKVVAELRSAQLGPEKRRLKAPIRPVDLEKVANFIGVPPVRYYLTVDDEASTQVQVRRVPLITPDHDPIAVDQADLGLDALPHDAGPRP